MIASYNESVCVDVISIGDNGGGDGDGDMSIKFHKRRDCKPNGVRCDCGMFPDVDVDDDDDTLRVFDPVRCCCCCWSISFRFDCSFVIDDDGASVGAGGGVGDGGGCGECILFEGNESTILWS